MSDRQNSMSTSRGSLGASTYVDGERCHVCGREEGARRLNIDGIWIVLGEVCLADLLGFIANPTDVDPRARERAAAARRYADDGWDL